MPNLSMNDRLVRLMCTQQVPMVVPTDGSQPFPVPQMPMSQLRWMDVLTDTFYETHGRCMCIALMLDVDRRAWGRPEVPTQRCDRDGVRWTWSAEDFAGRGAGMLVCGSFQSAVVDGLNEAVSLVPPTDGIHIVCIKGGQDLAYMFLHAEGQTMVVEIQDLVVDDTAAALKANQDRLSIE